MTASSDYERIAEEEEEHPVTPEREQEIREFADHARPERRAMMLDLLAALDAERARCVVLQQERDEKAVENYLAGKEAGREERAGLLARAEQAEDFLRRFLEWDHLATVGDGPFWRREAERVRVALAGPGDPEEPRELLCEKCGRDYPVWFAPSDLWNSVVRGGVKANPDEWAFLCPLCFALIAEERGFVPTAWVLSQEVLSDPEEPLCPVCQGPTRPTGPDTRRCVGGCYWPQGEETQ